MVIVYAESGGLFFPQQSFCDPGNENRVGGPLLGIGKIPEPQFVFSLIPGVIHGGTDGPLYVFFLTTKGMGNGLPIGGVIISPAIKASFGMLGTTFGGNHLACTAALAVLDIIENEHLVENAAKMGEYFETAFAGDKAISEYRGKGLMIGMELNEEYVGLRDKLLFERHFFTGAAGADVIRLLPSLTVSQETAESFVKAWKELTL